MNILDLFSGIGGFSLGLERAGMKTIAFCESDKFCQKVLKKHWPNVPIFEDITKLKGDMIDETIDLVCGGFPCQPFSVAGKRKGKEDDRYLWPEMLRIIQEAKPAWVIGENVAGIESIFQYDRFSGMEGKEYISQEVAKIDFTGICKRTGTNMLWLVLEDLEKLGYEVQPFIIPACAVNAPHRRDRIWIIAHSEGIGRKRRDSVKGETSGEDDKGIATESERPNKTFNTLSNTTSKRCNNRPDNRQERYLLRDENRYAQEGESARKGRKRRAREINTDANATHSEIAQRGLSIGEKSEYTRYRGNNWDENWIEVATRLCGMDARIPSRMDRLKCLGNSVVPQIVEIIGNYIMGVERTSKIQKQMFV